MKIAVPGRLAMLCCCGVDLFVDGAWTDKVLCAGIHLETGEARYYDDSPEGLEWAANHNESRMLTLTAPYRIRFRPEFHDDPELLMFVGHARDIGCEWDAEKMTLSGPPA